MTAVHAGTAVVVTTAETVPASALPLVRAAFAVHEAQDAPADLLAVATVHPVVLLTADLDHPAAKTLIAAGAPVLRTPGAKLVEAAAVMDRLRSPGGCPWDAEQTHDSLRQYLVEECFELLEAIEDGDRPALREELGDVLLQVLFHARIAQEHTEQPFTVDDVAAELVAKLVGRHPHVFSGGDDAVRDAHSQELRWEVLKQEEKRRESSVDGVATGQPALALAAKLAQRTARAGLPGDLLPKHDGVGERLFDLAALAKLAGQDPEGELRAVAKRFAEQVRTAERAARDAGVDPARMDHDSWRGFWPSG